MSRKLPKELIERLELLVKSDHWKTLKDFTDYMIWNVEDTLFSLKVDKYRANWSTVLIKQREAYKNIQNIDQLVKMEYDEEKMKHELNKWIEELIDELEWWAKKKK